MVYTLLRFVTTANRAAIFATLIHIAIKTFQFTRVPAQRLQSPQLPIRLIAIHLVRPGKYETA